MHLKSVQVRSHILAPRESWIGIKDFVLELSRKQIHVRSSPSENVHLAQPDQWTLIGCREQ